MSYGRLPYYIWSDGERVHFWGPHSNAEEKGEPGVAVPLAALAQYIASLAARGEIPLNDMVEWGKQLRGDLPKGLRVQVEGHAP